MLKEDRLSPNEEYELTNMREVGVWGEAALILKLLAITLI